MNTDESLKLLRILTAFKYSGSGIIGYFILIFSFFTAAQFTTRETYQPHTALDWLISASACLLLITILARLTMSRMFPYLRRVIYSKRIDVILYFSTGFSFIFISDLVEQVQLLVINNFYYPSKETLYITATLCSIFYLSYIVSIYLSKKSKKTTESYFIDDSPISKEKHDLIDFGGYLSNTETQIINNGSKLPLVLGIDAPWGDGKTSFINLLEKRFLESRSEFVFCKINVLKHNKDSNIQHEIAKQINASIQEKEFSPEINTLFNKLLAYIDQSTGVEIYGIKLKLPKLQEDNNIFSMIERIIQDLNFTVVIIIDDLDRLEFDQFKETIHSIKELFYFSNTRFVLAFDTSNLSKHFKNGIDGVNSYLAKFINVKFNLYQKPNHLAPLVDLLCEEIRTFGDKNVKISSINLSHIAKHINILLTDNFSPEYMLFIGNPRKIKHLINSIKSLNMANLNFSTLDIDPEDVIHLLLIQLYYPDAFRKIIFLEYNKSPGPLSVGDYSGPEKETQEKKIEKFVRANEWPKGVKFLLNKLFLDPTGNSSKNTEKFRKTRAIYNRNISDQGNLSRYIDLIVSPNKSVPSTTYMANLNYAELFIKNQTGFNKHLQDIESLEQELLPLEVIRLILAEPNKLKVGTRVEVISYIFSHIHDYSYLFFRNTRKTFLLDLARVIDSLQHSFNPFGQNVSTAKTIDDILIKGTEKEKGVFDRFYDNAGDVFGLADLLLFRSEISPNRSHSDFYYITKALARNSKYACITSGLTETIAIQCLRQISQEIYSVFQGKYVAQGRNLIREIYELTPTSLLSKEFELDEIPESEFFSAKQNLMIFVVYQLSNTQTSKGVGIGFYDLKADEDQHNIHENFNSYLFENCFNQVEDHILFIYFCLIRTLSQRGQHGLKEITKEVFESIHDVLNKEKTIEYWVSYKEAITKLIESDDFLLSTTYSPEDIKTSKVSLVSYLNSIIEHESKPENVGT